MSIHVFFYEPAAPLGVSSPPLENDTIGSMGTGPGPDLEGGSPPQSRPSMSPLHLSFPARHGRGCGAVGLVVCRQNSEAGQ